jgi:hypothetical protein
MYFKPVLGQLAHDIQLTPGLPSQPINPLRSITRRTTERPTDVEPERTTTFGSGSCFDFRFEGELAKRYKCSGEVEYY